MAKNDINKGLMQEYYIPKTEHEIAAATCSGYIFFSIFIAIGLLAVLLFA